MSIYKRANSKYWTIDIVSPSGKRIRRSSKTVDRRQAQELHDRIKVQLWEEDRLGIKPERSFEEACVIFLKLSQEQSDYRTKVRHVKHFLEHFSGRMLSSLTTDEILLALPTHRTYKYKAPTPITNATKNRYLSSIGRLFTIAYDAGWINKKLKLPRFKEKAVNIRWITKEEAQLLLSHIECHTLYSLTLFALMTGCRMSEIFNLTWQKVDFKNKIAHVTADTNKSELSRAIPLNQTALQLLTTIPEESEFVFLNSNGEKFNDLNRKAYNKAVAEAKLKPFTFHDLRHTWASWHAQDGTPLLVLKELGGWKKLEMVMKYAHLCESHLAKFSAATELTAHIRLSEEKKVVNL